MADMGEAGYRRYISYLFPELFFPNFIPNLFPELSFLNLFLIYFLNYSFEIDGRHGWGRLSDPATCFNSLHSMHTAYNAAQQKTI